MFRLRREKVRKDVRREIIMLKEQFKTVELSPCYGDADLKKKEHDLSRLWTEIYNLEKQINNFAFPVLQAVR